MSIHKRGGVYWYSFICRGERAQRNVRQAHRKVARWIGAAYRTALAKGEVGIVERKPVAALKDLAQRFIDYVQAQSAEKTKTIEFYAQQLVRQLDFEPLANARVDAIDEALIESLVQEPANGAKFGYVRVRCRKSRFARRNVPSTERGCVMLEERKPRPLSKWVSAERGTRPILGSSLDRLHAELRKALRMTEKFVLHWARQAYGTRLGEAGADAFTIMGLMVHSSVTVSQLCVHSTP